MTIDEAIARINNANPDELQTLEREIFHGGLKPVQSMIDRYTQKAIEGSKRTMAEKFGPDPEATILDRIEAIDRAADARVRKAQIDAHLKIRCHEAGVPFDVLADMPFDSAEAVDKKVLSVARAIAETDKTERRRLLNEDSFRPGGAGGYESSPRPESYSLADLNHLSNLELAELGR